MLFQRQIHKLLAPLLAAFATAAGAQTITTFAYTGTVQYFVVPDGVTSLWAEMRGGSGGNANHQTYVGATGGPAGLTVATLQVTAGEVLELYVGGRGSDGHLAITGSTVPSAGGFNGGGAGINTSTTTAGGGGGATDLRRAGQRLLVAGGGGGAAYSLSFMDMSGFEGGGLLGGGPAGGSQVSGFVADAQFEGFAMAGGGGGYFSGGAGSVARGTTSGSGGSGYVSSGPGVSDAGTYAGGIWDSPYFGPSGDGMAVLVYTVSTVPEPAAWLGLLAGGAWLARRRRA